MSSRLNGNSVLALATSNISSNYYYLKSLSSNTKGLTLKDILNPETNSSDNLSKVYSYTNSTFAQFLATNFSSIDVDKDGTISEDDMNMYTGQLKTTGLTYNQLAQMCASGSSNSLLETVLNNFQQIDKNGDGRVTSAEISAYGIEQEAEQVKDKYPKYDLSAMSIYYDTSSTVSKYEEADEN